MRSAKRFLGAGLAALFPFLGLAGCGSGHAKYTPTAHEARSSLEASLTAWRDGKPSGEIEATPPVRMVDSDWQGGQQIESFQIGDEEDTGDGTKQFTVKLTMKKAKNQQEVRYVVHGRDPVWVYREADYKRMLDMDNNPAPAKSKSVSGRAGRAR